MNRRQLLALWTVLGAVAVTQAQTEPGDYLVVSRTYGTVYSVSPTSGLIRGLVSGPELRDPSGFVRGNGMSLTGSFQTSLGIAPGGEILARFGQGLDTFGLASIPVASGDRARLPGTGDPLWRESGHIVALPDGTVYSTADEWYGADDPPGAGKVLQYDLNTGATTLVSGPGRGDGPVLKTPRGIALYDADRLLVAEWDLRTNPPGGGLYWVDLATGNRTFLSRLCVQTFQREMIVGGVSIGPVNLGPGGSGPITNNQVRDMVVVDGRIFLGFAIRFPDDPTVYDGGIIEVDPGTGDRTLVVGCGLVDDGTGQNVENVCPSNWPDCDPSAPESPPLLDAPIGLLENAAGRLAFTCLFGPNSIFEYDLDTGALFEVADVGSQLDPAFRDDLRFSGLAVSETGYSLQHVSAGTNLFGAGDESAVIWYDPFEVPPESSYGAPAEIVEALAAPAEATAPLSAVEPAPDGDPPGAGGPRADGWRVSASEKGSLLVYPKVELRWNSAGELIQDTFLTLNNDFNAYVEVQLYFVSETCSAVDNLIDLTRDEPAYWSAATGLPKVVSPWTVLGSPYPDPEGTTDMIMRGYVLAWASGTDGDRQAQIRWNHLYGGATIVNYAESSAWEYSAYAFPVVDDSIANGDPVGTMGEINLDGSEYANAFDRLLLDFFASGAEAFSGGGKLVTHDTDLTLLIAGNDLRQDGDGPATTKAKFEIWNENEVGFSGAEYCITKWDESLLSTRGGHFLVQNLQTAKGRARIDGVGSLLCPESTNEALLGVSAKLLMVN